MRRILDPPVLLRVLAPLILLPLLGLAARPHALAALQQQVGRARAFRAYPTLAKGLAAVASYQPWRPELWEQAGLYAFQGGDYENALLALRRAESEGRLSPLGSLYLGDAYRQAGDLEAAATAWEAARSGVDAMDLARRWLEIHEGTGDIPAVTSDLQELVALRPADVQLRYRLGLHLAAQQPVDALPHLAQAADLAPSLKPQADYLINSIRTANLAGDPAYLLLESGRALASIGEWALAAEAFRASIAAAPEYAEAWAYLGEAIQQLAVSGSAGIEEQTADDRPLTGSSSPAGGDHAPQGLTELEKALALDPRSLAANTLMALYWQRQGSYDLALEYLNKAIALYPDNAALQAQMGSTLALSGDLEAALGAYRRGVDLAPLQAEPWRLLAGFSVLHEYLLREEGLPAARRAAALDPKDPANLDMLGQVLLLLEDFSTSQRFFQTAIDLDPGFAPAQVHLGLVYALQGDTRRAYQAWKGVTAGAPGTPAAEQAERLIKNYFP